MKSTNKCPKCGSSDIATDAKAIDRGGMYNTEWELSVATFKKPEALVFNEKSVSPLSAWVCLSCGYVEFYADSPEQLRGVEPRELGGD